MNFCIEACADASMTENGTTAAIAGEVVCGYHGGNVLICYRYEHHVPIDNIHDAEWAGVLIAACYMNSWDMNRLIHHHVHARYVTVTIYTDRS